MNQLHLPRPRRRRSTYAPTAPVINPSQVRQLPPPQPAPVWLKSLLTVQKGATVLFGMVFGLSSIVYGYTIHTQGTWRSQHRQWDRLESQGRQQSVITENIKQKLAETAADKKSGLVAPTPQQMVFIPSAPQRPVKSVPLTQDQTTPVTKIPTGY